MDVYCIADDSSVSLLAAPSPAASSEDILFIITIFRRSRCFIVGAIVVVGAKASEG
jgi:hypothetical protein